VRAIATTSFPSIISGIVYGKKNAWLQSELFILLQSVTLQLHKDCFDKRNTYQCEVQYIMENFMNSFKSLQLQKPKCMPLMIFY